MLTSTPHTHRLADVAFLCLLVIAFSFISTGSVTAQSSGFGPRTTYSLNYPVSVAFGDLDGDGDLDLVVTKIWSHQVAVFFNQGDGIFTNLVDYGVGLGPYHIEVSDLDGDGDLDLLTANETQEISGEIPIDGENVSVLLNRGDGTFEPRLNYGAGSGSRYVTVGDLDKDGDLDLVTVNDWDDTILVLMNDGYGTFSNQATYSVGKAPTFVTVGDLDKDGDLDLVVTNGDDHTISVLLNRGDGAFVDYGYYGVGCTPHPGALGDLDGDGDLDLMIPNHQDGTVSVLLNQGNGTFGNRVDYVIDAYPVYGVVADMEGDGDLDLVVANHIGSNVSILFNDGDANFATMLEYSMGDRPLSVATADLNGDGAPDLATADYFGHSVSVRMNELHLQSSQPTATSIGSTNCTPQIPPLVITTDSPLPDGTIGEPYLVSLEAAGGTPPYTWLVEAGDLPPGLNLDENTGEISGVPTVAGTFGFTIRVTDSSSASATKPFGLAPPPPSGNAGSGYTLPIHIDPVPGSGGSDPGTCTNYTVTSGDLPPGLTLDPNTGVVSGTPINGGTYNFTIGCAVSGGQNDGQTATKDFTITIYNPTPTISSLDPSSATAGGITFVLTVNGTNFVMASTVHWNGASRPTTYLSATQLQAEIAAADIATEGTASITVINPDPGGGTSAPATFTITPANQPPIADAGGSYSGDEGTALFLAKASATDPDDDPLTFQWRVDSPLCSFSDPGSLNPTLTCRDNGDFLVTLEVSDGTATANSSATVIASNVEPTVGPISTIPADAVLAVGTGVNFSASFSDPGAVDTHTVLWDWDDGTTSAGIINETNGSGSVSGSHTYATAGIYTIKVTVTDDDGGSGESVFRYVVVYDPSAGFVTGGGWIDSPAGAYTADPTLTGKANFGFVSKYKKGATTPTGQTEFQFQVANLNFHSTSYDWLVVAGAKAQYKGVGTINGGGDYGFLLTAIDGAISGGGGSDKFRIKIWDKNNGDTVIYDNKMGESEDSDAATAISGGSIVIHKGGNGVNAAAADDNVNAQTNQLFLPLVAR